MLNNSLRAGNRARGETVRPSAPAMLLSIHTQLQPTHTPTHTLYWRSLTCTAASMAARKAPWSRTLARQSAAEEGGVARLAQKPSRHPQTACAHPAATVCPAEAQPPHPAAIPLISCTPQLQPGQAAGAGSKEEVAAAWSIILPQARWWRARHASCVVHGTESRASSCFHFL